MMERILVLASFTPAVIAGNLVAVAGCLDVFLRRSESHAQSGRMFLGF